MKITSIADLKKSCCMSCVFNQALDIGWANQYEIYRFANERVLVPCNSYHIDLVVMKQSCQFFVGREKGKSRVPYEIYEHYKKAEIIFWRLKNHETTQLDTTAIQTATNATTRL